MIKLAKEDERARTVNIIAALLCFVAVGGAAWFFGTKRDKEPPAKPVAVAAKAVPVVKKVEKTDLSEQDVYAAVFRAFRADKACIDRSNSLIYGDALLIRFPRDEDIKERRKDIWYGWWVLKFPKFHYLPGNDTWYLADTPYENFKQIWPTSKDHPCAEAKDYEDK